MSAQTKLQSLIDDIESFYGAMPAHIRIYVVSKIKEALKELPEVKAKACDHANGAAWRPYCVPGKRWCGICMKVEDDPLTYAERLMNALDKVPYGTPYIESPNWPEINNLLKEGTKLKKKVTQ